MTSTISPNMNLILPTVGQEPGPTYAFDQNTSFTLIDQHDHSPGRGVPITSAGLNIDTDLSMNDHSLINVESIVFTNQTEPLTTVNSVSTGAGSGTGISDLFFTDGTGTSIQITKSGIVNVTAASIPGESYSSGTFIWTQTQSGLPTTPANFDIGSITLRPNIAATAFGVTLTPPAAISSAFNVALPIPPAVTSFLQIDSSGNMSATIPTNQGITGTNIANQTITASKIANNTITTNQISLTAGITKGQLAADVLEWDHQAVTTASAGTPSFNVRVATTVAGTLSTSFHNTSVVDGVTLATNDLILIKNQAVASDNGVYVVQAAGSPTRSTSYDTFTELNYAAVHVTAGTVNTNTNWFQNNILTSLSDAQSWSNAPTIAFTVPANVNHLFFTASGGGGGGGAGGSSTGGGTSAGGGGGGGAGSSPTITDIQVTPGDVVNITVGQGGAAGAVTATTGGSGGNGLSTKIFNSNFSFVFSGATGGTGGTQNNPGTGGAAGTTYVTVMGGQTLPSAGGAGSNSTANTTNTASSGQASVWSNTIAAGGPSGGASSIQLSGGGGGGGGAAFGAGGGGGTGQTGNTGTGLTPGAAGIGAGSGGGGGGGAKGVAGAAAAGGAGADGQVLIHWLG